MKTRTKIIIAIVVVVSFCSLALYAILMWANRVMAADRRIPFALGQAIACYAIENEGRLPSDWDDLVHAGLASRPDPKRSDSLCIHAWMVSEAIRGLPAAKRRVTCTAVIDDVRDYEIAFGVDVTKLRVARPGLTVVDERGRPIVLMLRQGRRDWGEDYPRQSANIVELVHMYLGEGNVASRPSESLAR